MPFPLPTMAESRDMLVALGIALFPELNFGSDRSYHGNWATFLAAAMTQLHFHGQTAQLDLHPLTAGDGKPIGDWMTAVTLPPKTATPARKGSAGRIQGNAGATVISGTQMVHAQTGLIFAVANPTIVTIPGVVGVDPDSFVDADIVGVDVGSQTRIKKGQVLNFLSAPPGIQANVVLQLDLDEDGFDAEQFGSKRRRFLAVMSESRSGGSAADFVSWVEQSLAAVSIGYSFPNRAGDGTIDVAGFYAASGADRALTLTDRDAVTAYIRTKAPFQVAGVGSGLRTLLTVPDPQRVEIAVTTNGIQAFAFDWIDGGVTTVAGYNPTTRELQFAGGSLPASLRAGHGLVLDGTGSGSGVNAQDGAQHRIESISAVDKVILESPGPVVTPLSTDKIWSGGPLTTPLRDAVIAHLNGEIVYAGRGSVPLPASKAAPNVPGGPSIIGLDELAEGIGPANPGQKYGSWQGGILLGTLFKICTYKAGVANIAVISPSSDYQPLDDGFPNDAQIHYVTPAVVLIRRA